MASRVRLDGLVHALAAVGRIPGAMREARREVLHEWADDVEDTAQERVPERTGRLHNSIEQRVGEDIGVATVGVWKEDALEYAQYVEKGTSSMNAQPYLVPAFEVHRAEVASKYRSAFRRHIGGE